MKRLWILLLISFAACASEEGNQAQHEPPAETGRTMQGSGEVVWSKPEGWVEERPSSTMRKAQYRLPTVEGDPEDASVVVFYFQGGGGSVQANLDRWIDQFVQPDGRPSKEVAQVSRDTVNGLPQTTLDLTGTYLFQETPMASEKIEKPGFRMLASVIETSQGPHFVKMVGPEATVTHWAGSYQAFLKSFREK